MDDISPRYAQHRLDGYGFYLDLDRTHDALVIELSNEHPNPSRQRPLLELTVADARALRAFLSLPDVAAVLLSADLAYQHSMKLFHDDPANQD